MYGTRFAIGEGYKRSDIASLVGRSLDTKYPEGIEIISGEDGLKEAAILLVTLDKNTIAADYNDYFYMDGRRFRWESQNRDKRDSPRLKLISGGLETLLFCRVSQLFVSNKTRPHIYCGRLKWLKAFGNQPVKVDFTCLDWVSDSRGALAELYLWDPPYRTDESDE